MEDPNDRLTQKQVDAAASLTAKSNKRSTPKPPTVDVPVDSYGQIRGMTPVRRAAFWLALGVLLLLAVVTVMLVGVGLLDAPRPPNLDGLDVDAARATVDNYARLISTYWDQIRGLFVETVGVALLPMLTLVVGYIFGRDA